MLRVRVLHTPCRRARRPLQDLPAAGGELIYARNSFEFYGFISFIYLTRLES